jgi:hypothetical protein
MALRGISENAVRTILGAENRVAEAAPTGAPGRWRYAGWVSGRQITVIVAEAREGLVVITVF